MVPRPPLINELQYGDVLNAGMGTTTVIADFDFETYSPAGFIWDKQANKWKGPQGKNEKGLPVVGTAKYTEHFDAEVLCLAYDLKDGKGRRLWVPEDNPPQDLFSHIAMGFLLEAWNVNFEWWVWHNICKLRYGFPHLPLSQLRCAAAKSRAFALPGSLDPCGEVMDIKNKKLKDGKRLINLFSIPRNPTKHDLRLRIRPFEDLENREKLHEYCLRDIAAEAELSSLIPDLQPQELEFWQYDQMINIRGIQIDIDTIASAIKIVEEAHNYYNNQLQQITNGAIQRASEVQKLCAWLKTQGVYTDSLDEESCEELLKNPMLLPHVRKVLEIRNKLSSAAIKKLYSMLNQVTYNGRLHNLFIYHSARTGRAAGSGPQPQNLPNSGPSLHRCSHCSEYFSNFGIDSCIYCQARNSNPSLFEWNNEIVKFCISLIKKESLGLLEYYFKDPLPIIAGCLRGMFISAPGKDLIGSDYSAIEAVVLAALAGEEWRMEVFRTHGMIYEMSASKITGLEFEEFKLYKATSGQHHPLRKKVGKVAELASGYQGWIGAWKNFGADEFFNDDEIKKSILAWRAASPKIVEFWGGQFKGWQQSYHGLEGCAIQAVLFPGQEFSHNGITYIMKQDILYCRLLSGRYLTYHRPRLTPAQEPRRGQVLTFEGWNTNVKNGAVGWIRMTTYGGKLTENVVQATARDILAHAIVKLEKAGYPVVLHVHDEIVVEISENHGSVEEMESIMSTMPDWAKDWPIKASGGWRAKRYQK